MSVEQRMVRALENQRIAQRNQRVVMETLPERAFVSSAGGDHLVLRGIPAIGPSVEGAIIGTRPDTAIVR